MSRNPQSPSPAGQVLARLRAENGWTLVEVAAKTGVSVSTLSKIENGQTSPSYAVMTRLATGLGVDFVHLIGGNASQMPHGVRSITRAGEGMSFQTEMGAYRALASDLVGKVFEPMLIDIPVRKTFAERSYSAHRGEEFVFVVSGPVEFLMEPYAPIALETGDSVYFDGSCKHGFRSLAKGPAQILSVCLGSRSDHAEQAETTGETDEG